MSSTTQQPPRRRAAAAPAGLAAVALAVTGVALWPQGAWAGDHGHGHGRAKPKNVIFIMGDGMGAAHREAGRLDQVGLDGQLAMDSLPVQGLQTTDPRDPEEVVTDSAAAATAWATGEKSYNGAISVDVDGKPLPFLGQQAKEAGRATGLVTTSQVTDASPAAFFSSTPDRDLQSDIAKQYLEVSQPDVILGGGEDRWLPEGTPGAFPDNPLEDPEEASSGTQGDLVAEAEGLGYDYVSSADELAASTSGKLLGLFANEEMFQQRPEGQGDVYDPVVALPDMTQKALDTLGKHKEGFFLFVEEEAVDEFSHSNNASRVLQAERDLDQTVALAREYVADHPDTLLVVTGDHECGGLTVEDVDPSDESGPGGTAPQETAVTGETPSGEDGPFPVAGSDREFVVDWTTSGHSGVPVPVSAEGPGSERLDGAYPNTHLHQVLYDALVGGAKR